MAFSRLLFQTPNLSEVRSKAYKIQTGLTLPWSVLNHLLSPCFQAQTALCSHHAGHLLVCFQWLQRSGRKK